MTATPLLICDNGVLEYLESRSGILVKYIAVPAGTQEWMQTIPQNSRHKAKVVFYVIVSTLGRRSFLQ
jgi:hypothetical protein